jgi:signal transduction histidine kinase
MISMASHEFRTPLTTIQSSTDLLENYTDRMDSSQRQKHLNKIKTQIKNLLEMLDDMLTVLRNEATVPEFKPIAMDVVAFCNQLINEIQTTGAPQHRLELVTACESAIIEGDEKLLRHSLENLVSNAIKYSPQGGTVSVEVSCDTGWVNIRVRDEGIGIPEADHSTLFKPFHRGSNVGTIKGTGLGLVIAKQAAELHNGSIAVESAMNKGTIFTLRFPMKQANT